MITHGKFGKIEYSLHPQEPVTKLVIQVHGLRGGKDSKFRVEFANKLYKEGYSVFRINFSEGSYVSTPHGAPLGKVHSQQVEDLETVMDHLTSKLNPSSIGIIGPCTGANAALVLASKEKYYPSIDTIIAIAPYEWRSVCPIEGAPDEKYIEMVREYLSEERRARGLKKVGVNYTNTSIVDGWEQDLTKRVSEIPMRLPILFINGHQDPLVTPDMVIPLVSAKRGLMAHHQILARSHGYANPQEVEAINSLALDWFEKYLK